MGDRIFTADLFDDRPVEGFASLAGDPHHFKCEYDYIEDEYTEIYRLTPVSAATLGLARERQQISLRWNAAVRAGEISSQGPPALPQERARYEALEAAIARALDAARDRAWRACARFLPDGSVEWSKLDAG